VLLAAIENPNELRTYLENKRFQQQQKLVNDSETLVVEVWKKGERELTEK